MNTTTPNNPQLHPQQAQWIMRMTSLTTALSLITAALLLGGCATQPRGAQYQPIIDTKGKSPQQYQADLYECQAYAHQAQSAGGGAATGALAGAAVAAVLSHNKSYQGDMVGKGLVLGAAGGAAKATNAQETVVRRCMSGRGYRVLL